MSAQAKPTMLHCGEQGGAVGLIIDITFIKSADHTTASVCLRKTWPTVVQDGESNITLDSHTLAMKG